MKPIKEDEVEGRTGPWAFRRGGGSGCFSVSTSWGLRSEKTRTIYSKHDHSGLLKRLTVFERLPYIIYDFLGI